MPAVMPPSFKAEIERPQGSNPFVWFLELEVAKPWMSGDTVMPGVILRVCSHHQTLLWPAGSPGSETWYPFNFSFTPIEQNQEGDLPQLDLSVDNTARTLMRYLHDGEGLEGNNVKLIHVPANGLAIAHPNHEYKEWTFQIAGAIANDESVIFRLERANFFTRMSPQDRFIAASCRWEFGGPECGYIINDVAAYTTCPKTIDACKLRGLDHLSRGLAVLHPGRFGGFPGIPKQR